MNADPMMVIQQASLALAYIVWFVFNAVIFAATGLLLVSLLGRYVDRVGDWLFGRKPH